MRNGASTVNINNTIIAQNKAKTSPDCSGKINASHHNIVQNISNCDITAGLGDKFNVDPKIGTTTIGAVPYVPLQPTSPAVNAGSGCPAKDQRGVTRPQGSKCDIGAYEYKKPGPVKSIGIAGGGDQYAIPGTTYKQLFAVYALDSYGSPVENVSLVFTAPSSGPSGTFNNGLRQVTVKTNNVGLGVAPKFTANSQPGIYSLIAETSGFMTSFTLSQNYWYVSPDGDDDQSCIESVAPCRTIQKALEKAVPGGLVRVAEGTYTGINQVVEIHKSIQISGGWDEGFTGRIGHSVFDEFGIRIGSYNQVSNMNVSLDRIQVKNNNNVGMDVNAQKAVVRISNCVVAHNRGGGIVNNGTMFIDRCLIHDNVVEGTGNGGGVANYGRLTMTDSQIYDNYASRGGGVYGDFDSKTSIDRSAIYGNFAWHGGGGIVGDPYNASLKVTNSTIAYNISKQRHGGIKGPGTFNNVTVAYNSAYEIGGVEDGNYKNSIIAFNSAAHKVACTFTAVSNIFIFKSDDCATISSPDAKLIMKADPRLLTFVPGKGYFALAPNSPAVNAGNLCAGTTDQRGVKRSGVCDIGSYEYVAPKAVADVEIMSGNRQRSVPGNSFKDRFSVLLLDVNGTPVTNASPIVVFEAPDDGASGTFFDGDNHDISIVASNAFAQSPKFTSNEILGEYEVSVYVSGTNAQDVFRVGNGFWAISQDGNDANLCLGASLPCKTINGVYEKAEFYSGDVIRLADGEHVQPVTQFQGHDVDLSAGWNEDFSIQIGYSNINTILRVDAGVNLNADRIVTHSFLNEGRTLFSNGAIQYGNGVRNEKTGNLVLQNVTVSKTNNPSYAIENYGILKITNGSIVDNAVTESTIYNGDNGVITLLSSTVAGNRSTSGADVSSSGGIRNYTSKGAVYIGNTIVAGNQISTGGVGGADCDGRIISLGYNVVGTLGSKKNATQYYCQIISSNNDWIGAGSALPSSEIFGQPAQINGIWYMPLKAGSLAIDKGNPFVPGSSETACPVIDQRGVARPQSGRCDIGAYEYEVESSTSSALIRTFDAGGTMDVPETPICTEADWECVDGSEDAKMVHKLVQGVYEFYQDQHGRDSLDGQGVAVLSSVRYGANWKNTYWNGHMMLYGDGYGYAYADDIVAHEFTHGVTQYESNLFPWYQSGAIRESLSDIWGEAFDQLNGMGTDTAEVRWLIGEDIAGLGAIRSMKTPEDFNHPGKMTSHYYVKSSEDNGGIHSNGGVNNKAAYLMVDGAVFNGVTVAGLGWDKVLAIYYEAQTNLLTSASDYLDLYYVLPQACLNLVGMEDITQSDCDQVLNAVLAVEMNKEPVMGFNPSLPNACGAGSNHLGTLYLEDFESGTGNWVFPPKNWNLVTAYATSGDHAMWLNDSSFVRSSPSLVQAKAIKVPSGVKTYLQFKHAFGFEYGKLSGLPANFDGGVVEYSVNGGAWKDAGALFNAGKNYNGLIKSYTGSGNPLAGRSAFVKESNGHVDTRYDLSGFAGKNVKFRWRAGTDYVGHYAGWFIDDVQIVTCKTVARPTLQSPRNKVALSNNLPLFDWTDVADVTGYTIQVSKSSSFSGAPLINTTVTDSYFLPANDLPVNMVLYWRVAGNTVSGRGAWSKPFSLTTGNPPVAPLLMAPAHSAVITESAPLFDWSDSVIPSGTKYKSYHLQVSTDASFADLVLQNQIQGSVVGSEFTPLSDLSAGWVYYWRVRTYNTLGQFSNWSDVFSFTLLPSPPTLLSPAVGEELAETSVLLDWSDVSGATSYTLELSLSVDFEEDALLDAVSVTDSEYTPENSLSDGSPIYWRVRAESLVGSGDWSVGSFSIAP